MEKNQNFGSKIMYNRIIIDSEYINGNNGILNALSTASAQYIFKVIEKHNRANNITNKRIDDEKIKKLKRTIIHKSAHLDEYFAELIFRSILPPYLKDIDIKEHTLISKDNDAFAKISWPNAAVFGIHADETGGAKALLTFDEHNPDGTRIKASCSQLVAEEFLSPSIPPSIKTVLDEVNFNDSGTGAHPFHFAHIIKEIHDVFFILGKDDIYKNIQTKFLTEQWKRAIIDSVLTSMVYSFENDGGGVILNRPYEILKATEESFNYFVEHNALKSEKYYNETVEYCKNSVVTVKTIFDAKWKMNAQGMILPGKERPDQILIIPRICFSLNFCFGKMIAKFIMMHIWNILFQRQMNFFFIQNELKNFKNSSTINGEFGKISRYEISNEQIKPEESGKKINFNLNSNIWLIDIQLTNPIYFNITKPIQNFLNNDYTLGGNNGFGIFILHDKIINSTMINRGTSFPREAWKKLSDKIRSIEPELWFQLFNKDGTYADFILNRTKAHQDIFPSNIVDIDFMIKAIKEI